MEVTDAGGDGSRGRWERIAEIVGDGGGVRRRATNVDGVQVAHAPPFQLYNMNPNSDQPAAASHALQRTRFLLSTSCVNRDSHL